MRDYQPVAGLKYGAPTSSNSTPRLALRRWIVATLPIGAEKGKP
jgi:hypothetical protein